MTCTTSPGRHSSRASATFSRTMRRHAPGAVPQHQPEVLAALAAVPTSASRTSSAWADRQIRPQIPAPSWRDEDRVASGRHMMESHRDRHRRNRRPGRRGRRAPARRRLARGRALDRRARARAGHAARRARAGSGRPVRPEAVAAVVALGGGAETAPLRGLVNLVGGFAMGGRVHETPVDEFETQFRLNLRPDLPDDRGRGAADARGRRRLDRLRRHAGGAAAVHRAPRATSPPRPP